MNDPATTSFASVTFALGNAISANRSHDRPTSGGFFCPKLVHDTNAAITAAKNILFIANFSPIAKCDSNRATFKEARHAQVMNTAPYACTY